MMLHESCVGSRAWTTAKIKGRSRSLNLIIMQNFVGISGKKQIVCPPISACAVLEIDILRNVHQRLRRASFEGRASLLERAACL